MEIAGRNIWLERYRMTGRVARYSVWRVGVTGSSRGKLSTDSSVQRSRKSGYLPGQSEEILIPGTTPCSTHHSYPTRQTYDGVHIEIANTLSNVHKPRHGCSTRSSPLSSVNVIASCVSDVDMPIHTAQSCVKSSRNGKRSVRMIRKRPTG